MQTTIGKSSFFSKVGRVPFWSTDSLCQTCFFVTSYFGLKVFPISIQFNWKWPLAPKNHQRTSQLSPPNPQLFPMSLQTPQHHLEQIYTVGKNNGLDSGQESIIPGRVSWCISRWLFHSKRLTIPRFAVSPRPCHSLARSVRAWREPKQTVVWWSRWLWWCGTEGPKGWVVPIGNLPLELNLCYSLICLILIALLERKRFLCQLENL